MSDDHPIISTSRVPASDIPRRSFATVRRGFDPDEVRAFLELVAKELEAAEHREQELLHELSAAEERARHPVIDESVLTSALGQHSAAVLRGAHEEAARVLSQAEETAATMTREAQHMATETQVNAESSAAERIAEAELEANAVRQQARDEAVAVLEAARQEGETLVERARDHGRSMLDQAQEARRRVLADMAQRRRLVTEQIEQFRAARDEIAGSVVGVRRSLDRIVEDLSRADDAARAAAVSAARPHAAEVPESVLVEEGERAAAALAEAADAVEAAPAAPAAPHRSERPGSFEHAEGFWDAEEGPNPAHAEPPSEAPKTTLRFDDIATVVPPGSEVVDVHPWAGSSGEEAAPAPDVSAAVAVHDWENEPSLIRDPLVDDASEQVGAIGPSSGDPAHGTSDVDGLFARLRARQVADDVSVAAVTVIEAEGGAESRDVLHRGGETTNAADTADGADGADGADTADGAPASAPARYGTSAIRPDGAHGADEDAEPSADEAAFAHRSAALDPIVTAVARRLKRALQDDQNRLLDLLRQGTGQWSDDLLVDEESQKALYTKAASGAARDAMTAGIAFARAAVGGRQGKTPAADPRAVDAVSSELASTIVSLLRRRLEGGEIPDAAERIGAAYREWRGERIERLAEDGVVEAFSRGVLAGAGRRSGVRWVRSDVGPGCADCEDNALAGAVGPGEPFPTGHLHPPAHAGCRCLVLPAPS